jgi:hypothetical protein
MAFRVGVFRPCVLKALFFNGYKVERLILHTVLHTIQHIFHLIYRITGALFSYMIVYPKNHFFVGMAHPNHGLFHIYTSVTEEAGAVGMA